MSNLENPEYWLGMRINGERYVLPASSVQSVFLYPEAEQSLKDLISKANAKGIKYSAFTEPDLNDSLTSIVLEPCEEASKMCSSLQLAFKEYNNHFNALNGKEVACGN